MLNDISEAGIIEKVKVTVYGVAARHYYKEKPDCYASTYEAIYGIDVIMKWIGRY